MKHKIYVLKRIIHTFFSKFFAELASATQWKWTVFILDKALKNRDKALCKEAKCCMSKVIKWQKKAQNCLAAHKSYEKELNNTPEKQ